MWADNGLIVSSEDKFDQRNGQRSGNRITPRVWSTITHTHILIYIYINVCVYIYIYIERERETDIYIYIYISIYTYIYFLHSNIFNPRFHA